MSEPSAPAKVYKALYHFKGSNNDELWFNKGDIVTVTQMIEGGWWEGTLDGKTGWFPSNFVKETKQDGRAGAKSPTSTKPSDLPLTKRESILTYHDVVIRSLKDTERTFVNDLHLLLQTYLRPLQNDTILSKTEYGQLCGNLEELASMHHHLLSSLDECAKLPVNQQRVGGLFIKLASQLKAFYGGYCANHPSAVSVLQKRRDDLCTFMENKGAPPPGIETLTTSLSKPFTRLDKYSSMLKELERHTEESHIDRGDTQRAISVYRDIASSCADIRKQKEVEFEIMNSPIKGWEGEEISKLGEVLLLSHVRVDAENGEKKERLFLLFPSILVVLSVSPRMSQYYYEGKLSVTGLTVNSLEETDSYSYAFEITGSMIDRRVVSCGSSMEKKQWMDTLRQQAKLGPAHVPSKPQNVQIPTSQPSITSVPQAKTAQVVQNNVNSQPQKPKVASHTYPLTPWSQSCLRPAPPLRPILVGREEVARSPRSGRRLLGTGKRKPAERALSEDDHMHHTKRNDPKTLEEDALILKVIEAYCTSAKARHTVNSLDLTKIRLTPHELRDGRLDTTDIPKLPMQCDLVLSGLDIDPDLLHNLELSSDLEEHEGQGHLLDSDSSSEHDYEELKHIKNLKRRNTLLRKLCCFGYSPTKTIAHGFTKL